MDNTELLLSVPKQIAEKYGTGEEWLSDNFFFGSFHILELHLNGRVIGYIGHARDIV